MLCNLIILVSFNHIGDYNQALEIKKMYQQAADFSIELVNVEGQPCPESKHFIQAKYLHSIGQKAMIALAKIKNELLIQILIVQIHQHFEELCILKPTILIIPKINYRQKPQLANSHSILLQGTPFQKISNQKLKQIYDNSIISKEVNLNKPYIIVMLSGDAPDGNLMKCFTRDSADYLFLRLVYLLGKFQNINYKIIVQNGPRTGKHSPETLKEVCLHKFNKGQNEEIAIDQISKYFIEKLKQQGIEHQFYNFSFEFDKQNKKVNSFYKPLLYVAQQDKNIFLFPMESISMCSELPYYIQPQKLYAYFTSSTNQSHLKFVQTGFQKGLYHKFSQKSLKIQNPKSFKMQKYDESIQTIQQILFLIKQIKIKKKKEISEQGIQQGHQETQLLKQGIEQGHQETQLLKQGIEQGHQETQLLKQGIEQGHQETQLLKQGIEQGHQETQLLKQGIDQSHKEPLLNQGIKQHHQQTQLLKQRIEQANQLSQAVSQILPKKQVQ